jgi:hypothetical protein
MSQSPLDLLGPGHDPGADNADHGTPSHQIDPRFPYAIRAVIDADGTPHLRLTTSASGYRDRTNRSWLSLTVDAVGLENDDLYYPMPQPDVRYSRVYLPIEAWIDQRTAGIAPQALTDAAADYMTLDGWHGNDHGARRLAEWAERFSPAELLCSGTQERMFLDEEIYVILFRHPEHGPIAAVLYMDSGDEGSTYDLQLWHSTATAEQWTHWADFDLQCPQGHAWRYRNDQVTGPDGAVHAHLDLWPTGVGYPAICAPKEPGSDAWLVRCPSCAAECAPRLAALRD